MDKQTESRKAFEECYLNAPNFTDNESWAWTFWQLSRDSLVVEIASHTEFEIEHMISPEKEGYSLGWIDGRNYAARQVEAIGIRIKGEGDES